MTKRETTLLAQVMRTFCDQTDLQKRVPIANDRCALGALVRFAYDNYSVEERMAAAKQIPTLRAETEAWWKKHTSRRKRAS